MPYLYFATTNKGKVTSIQRVLASHGVKVNHLDVSIAEPRVEDLSAIAKAKVLAAYKKVKAPCISQDSGFYLHSAKGAPGALVHSFLKKEGLAGILKMVKGKRRTCDFRDCIAYVDDTLKEPIVFESRTTGRLAKDPRGKIKEGKAWSELWLLFIPKGFNKTLAEMTPTEMEKYRKIRHKNSAVTNLGLWLKRRKSAKIKKVIIKFRKRIKVKRKKNEKPKTKRY